MTMIRFDTEDDQAKGVPIIRGDSHRGFIDERTDNDSFDQYGNRFQGHMQQTLPWAIF